MSETAWPITATDFPGPKGSGPFFSSVMPAFELSSDMARCSSDPTTSVPIFWYLFGTATVMLHQETVVCMWTNREAAFVPVGSKRPIIMRIL